MDAIRLLCGMASWIPLRKDLEQEMNDIIITRPTSYQEWMSLQWYHALTSTLAKKGKRIPVMWEADCWNCNKLFLAAPYQNYCSERCTTIGEWKENNWDLENK